VRAGIYCRISQDREAEGIGVERQERDCRALAEQRGWDVADVYVDNDVSAYTGKPRPSFRRLLDDIEAKRVGAVIAWHPDRLYRHPSDLETFVDAVDKARAKVATVAAGEIDLGSASGRMVARMLGAAARGESERASERLKAQRLQQVREGRRQGGGMRPFGYTTEMEPHPTEAPLVREAVDRTLGGTSVYHVAADWNDRGILTTTGKRWRAQSLRRTLTRPLLAGLREHKPSGTVVPGAWEPIISEDEHRLLVAKFPEGSGTGERTARRKALLSGLLCCADCGVKLVYSHDRYICDKSRNGGCGKTRVSKARELELAVLQLAEKRAERRARGKDREQGERAALLAELKTLDDRLAMLTEMLGAGELDRGAYVEQRTRINAERAAIEEQLRDAGGITDEQATTLWEAVEAWESARQLSPAQIALLQDGITAALGPCVRIKSGVNRGPFDRSRIVVEGE
jgi:DNA invertase Pin-like site-specific DNA recombinase